MLTSNNTRRKLYRAIAALGVAALTLSPVAALAEIFQDDKGAVYITGTDAAALGDRAAIGYVGSSYSRRIRAGYCGEIRIAPTRSMPTIGTTFAINGATYDSATFPVDDNKKCTDAAFTDGSATSWKDSRGRIYIVDGFSAGVRYEVAYNEVDNFRNRSANRCGFFRLTNTFSNPLPAALNIGGTEYTVASLPVQNPPLCRRDATTPGAYVTYTAP